MLDQVLKLFNIRPDYDLNIMRQGQDLYDITARVLTGMRGVLQEAKPDIVLVHGDTTTSTASALAAFYQQIPVGHVEAGLRTHNIYSPWPEEMNTLLKQLDTELMSAGYKTTPLAEQNSRKLVLITGHRRENFGDGFRQKDSGRAVCGGRLCLPYALEPKCKEAHSRNIRKCLSP